ncbi:HIT family protein [Martelella mediterranea]|uniref:Diadenosine tetraphosphate (Ap4A) HIT family hydrolase n=1 Tax=Martelella mediterranea TaxID=293089 RepID=A0A4R3NH77_9HYPH|nr:HIT family protein [Martelella mediterranea]TCT33092.1 diadenosine tetraphosphate (Ap4A) HIT family hydrolase [Martelella mediterranea]
MQEFTLDERLERDSICLANLGLTQLRLMKDGRWPWLIAVPRRADVTEVFELAPLDQTMLTFEVNEAAKALKGVTGAEKINIAMIGNQVRQLHVHIVARFSGDPNWPGPIWGYGEPVFHTGDTMKMLAVKITEAMSDQ